MRMFRSTSVAVMVFITISAMAADQRFEIAEMYLQDATTAFVILRGRLPENRAKFWSGKRAEYWQAEYEVAKKHEREEEEYRNSNSVAAQLSRALGMDNEADIWELKLRNRTALVEGIGTELLQGVARERLIPRLVRLETRLMRLRNGGDTGGLERAVDTLYSCKERVDEILARPPIKRTIVFAPPVGMFDTTPNVRGEFILHDWVAALDIAAKLDRELATAERDSAVREFFIPQDPRSDISLSLQLAFLMVAIAGYTVSYSDKPRVAVIASVAFVGMLLSIVLVLVSNHTILNVFVQSLVPGSFILWWAKKKHRLMRATS